MEWLKLNKQNNALTEEIKREERQYTESIKKLTEKFEKENRTLTIKNSNNMNPSSPTLRTGWGNLKWLSESEFNRYKNEWLLEKLSLTEKLDLQKEQNMKAVLYEELMHSFKSLEKSSLQTQDANSKLSDMVDKLNNKIKGLEEKNDKSKTYKNMFKLASKIEWDYWKKNMTPKLFSDHVKSCPPKESPFGAQNTLIPLKIDFISFDVNSDLEKNYVYGEYELEINYRDVSYNVIKKINLFIGLVDNLEQHFPGLTIPPLPDVFFADDDERAEMKEEGIYAEDYTEILKNLMHFFSLSPIVRESIFFKKFLEMDKRFPDEFSKSRNKQNKNGFKVKRVTIGLKTSISNFDLMPDRYVNSIMSPKEASKKLEYMYNSVRFNYNTHKTNNNWEVLDIEDDEAWVTGE